MKKICFLFTLLLFTYRSVAITADSTYTLGIEDIKLGAPYESVKKYFLKDKVVDHVSVLGNEQFPEDKTTDKNAYVVDLKNKKFATYLGVAVRSIEVMFDQKNKVRDILVMFVKNETNSDKVQMAFIEKFKSGNNDVPCSMGPNATFMCCLWKDIEQVCAFDWNGKGEITIDKYVYVEFETKTY